MSVYRIRNKNTGEFETDPRPMPNRWKPIFGIDHMLAREGLDAVNAHISTLEPYAHWEFVEYVEPVEPKPTEGEKLERLISQHMEATAKFLPANAPYSAGHRQQILNYRTQLNSIRDQAGFPHKVQWPRIPNLD